MENLIDKKKNLTEKEAFTLALQHHQKNNLKVAENLYREILKINPNHAPANNNLGAALNELGEHQKAIDCYEKAIQINPNYVSAHYNLGNILQESGELQKAKSCYEKLLNLDPNNKKGCSNYGILLLKIAQHNKGLAYIRKSDGVIRFTQKDVKII